MSVGSNIVSNTVTVPTTAPAAAGSIASRTIRKSIVLQNLDSSNPVYWGDASVSSSTGIKILAGGSLTVEGYNGAVFLRSTGGSVDVRYAEIY